MSYYGGWAPYVSVAERRRRALKKMSQLRKKGMDIRPIEIEGRKITRTFWGQAWCDHMESLGDFANRLPRGRTYVRNGSVCHLAIDKGQVTAMVSGSSLYNIKVQIDVLPKSKWKKVKSHCAGEIGSLLELLQGRLSDKVMGVVTDSSSGLFPLSKEIRLSCSCPDWATMCKHVAAVLYGVGARLDERPELLFLLRGVEHQELIRADAEAAVSRATRRGGKRRTVASGDLSDVFGIELDSAPERNGDSVDPVTPTTSVVKRFPPRKKRRTVTSRRKKSKAGKKAASTSATKKPSAKSRKKKAAKKNVSKKKAVKKKAVKKKAVKKKASRKTSPGKRATTSAAKKKAVSSGRLRVP
ncbi:MAG: SWIM zinc finger family protein [Pirellulales bacterium]